jgi:F-type H+-transporting ATPase subunit b
MRLKTFGMAGLALAGMLAFSGEVRAQGAPSSTAPAAEVAGVEATTKAGHAAVSEKKGEPEEKEDVIKSELSVGTLSFTIAVFVCLFIVLRLTAWKPIMTGLKNREQAIRDSIEAAAKAKAEAERTTKDLEAKMLESQRQSAAQLTQAKADALKIADTIRAQAETEAAALKDRTLREIEAAKTQALTEINGHAAALGTAVARKILQRQVTVDDQQRLVDESLAEMAKKN